MFLPIFKSIVYFTEFEEFGDFFTDFQKFWGFLPNLRSFVKKNQSPVLRRLHSKIIYGIAYIFIIFYNTGPHIPLFILLSMDPPPFGITVIS